MNSLISRALIPAAAVAGLLILGTGTAAAHVSVDAPGAEQGGYSVATFKVPTESETASTTALTVTIPNLKSARTEPIPGWTAKVERNDKSEVTAITWTADPGAPGVGPGQFQRFAISLGPLPKQETVTFPAKQTYSDGKIVDWNQPMGADGAEPEHPAPSITLAEATGDEHGSTATAEKNGSTDTDKTARWLGGIGLALGLLGVGLGLGNVIRRRQA